MIHSRQILTALNNNIQILLVEDTTASDLLNLVSDKKIEEFGFDEDYTYYYNYDDEDYTYHYKYDYDYTYFYSY